MTTTQGSAYRVLEHKLVMLGGGGVGKSALTIRFVMDDFLEDYDPTIEDNYRKQVSIDDQVATLDILDTAGQEEFYCLQDQWIREGQGFLLVYSVTLASSFDEVRLLYEKILRTKESSRIPVVLVGNKCDLRTERRVETAQGASLAKQWGCPFFETSAKTKHNIENCFHQLVREIRKENPTKLKKVHTKSKCAIL